VPISLNEQILAD